MKERNMHELGVLCNVSKTVCRIAEQNGVTKIKYITLEVGTSSEIVPEYLEKLFPAAREGFAALAGAELRIESASGKAFIIKEIGY